MSLPRMTVGVLLHGPTSAILVTLFASGSMPSFLSRTMPFEGCQARDRLRVRDIDVDRHEPEGGL